MSKIDLEFKVYTDGACKVHSTKRGGWAYKLLKVISTGEEAEWGESLGGSCDTTSQRMELTSAIKALDHLCDIFDSNPIKVTIHSDSKYLVNGFNLYLNKWNTNGWVTSSGNGVKNKDLWLQLSEYSSILDLEFKWTKGHADDHWNNYVDKLADKACYFPATTL